MKKIGLIILVALFFCNLSGMFLTLQAANNHPLQDEVIIQTASGLSHTIALTEDGDVFVWGKSTDGALGLGESITQVTTPTKLDASNGYPELEKVTTIGVGYKMSAFVTITGRVYISGDNQNGTLGNDSNVDSFTFIEITSFFPYYAYNTGERIVQIIGNETNTYALTNLGNMYTFGNGAQGRLGNGGPANSLVPALITGYFPVLVGDKVVEIEVSDRTVVTRTELGRVFSFGSAQTFGTGDGTGTDRFYPYEITQNFSNGKIINIEAGDQNFGAITDQGHIFIWGIGSSGQLGNGQITWNQKPLDLGNSFVIGGVTYTPDKYFLVGSSAYMTVNESDDVIVWGGNLSLQLGIFPNQNRFSMEKVSFTKISGMEISDISGSIGYAIIRRNDGRLYGIGNNLDGQIAQNMLTYEYLPKPIFEETYQVKLHGFDGTVYETITVFPFTTVTVSPAPAVPGYRFVGWYDTKEPNESSVEKSSFTMSAIDINLYALYEPDTYTIVFSGYDGTTILELEKTAGDNLSEITLPTPPTVENKIFTGWSAELPSTMPSNNIEISANYATAGRIEFVMNGGTALDPIVAVAGSALVITSPERINYEFSGWYLDTLFTVEFESSTLPEGTTVLYALWLGVERTIYHRDYDGSIINTNVYRYGDDLSGYEIENPSREGYSFSGWDIELPATMPFTNITRLATYLPIQPTVTGITNGAVYKSGESVTLTFDRGTATLNGVLIENGKVVNKQGDYELIVEFDGAQTVVHFTIEASTNLNWLWFLLIIPITMIGYVYRFQWIKLFTRKS